MEQQLVRLDGSTNGGLQRGETIGGIRRSLMGAAAISLGLLLRWRETAQAPLP